MSKIDKTFFKWKPEVIDSIIELNESKYNLLSKPLIEEIKKDKEPSYIGKNGTPWAINFENDKVSAIWYNRDSSFIIDKTEICGAFYEEIKPLVESNFESLNAQIKNVEEMKIYNETDVLYIICRDFFVTMIGIIKRKPNNG